MKVDPRDIDLFIAERIMGFQSQPYSKSYVGSVAPSVPCFSTNEAAAATYLPKIIEVGARLTVEEFPASYDAIKMYRAVCEFEDQKWAFRHEVKPLAIAMAVCAAFGFEPLKQKPEPKAPGE